MSAPFTSESYDIAPATAERPQIALAPLMQEDVVPLADAFATMDPWARYDHPAAAMASYLETTEPGAPRFAVRCGGALAGAAGLRLSWLRGPYIQFVGLLAPCQRRGIGSAIIDWAEAQARAGKERNLWIAASEINTGAIRLYERLGFVQTAWLEDLVCDGFTEVLMRKRL